MKDRILIVDDMEIWRDILRKKLQNNYHVDVAASLSEALEKLNNLQPYQVVVTDIGLSKSENNTEGIELLKAVHKDFPSTVTIAISGRVANPDKKRFKEEYHALEYLEREVLGDKKGVEEFIRLVEKAVFLSHDRKNEE